MFFRPAGREMLYTDLPDIDSRVQHYSEASERRRLVSRAGSQDQHWESCHQTEDK